MDAPIYVLISIVVLAVVFALVFVRGRDKRRNRLTPLAGLAFAFVVAGVLFGDNPLIGYGLMGVGVVLAVIDVVRRSTRRAA